MKVLNKHRDVIPPDAIYIGRGSKWGNPFSHMKGTKARYFVESRDEAIEAYEEWLLNNVELLDQLDELIGKDLWCFCKPKRCHGDVLIKLVRILIECKYAQCISTS